VTGFAAIGELAFAELPAAAGGTTYNDTISASVAAADSLTAGLTMPVTLAESADRRRQPDSRVLLCP
jgi:hypothetical protein